MLHKQLGAYLIAVGHHMIQHNIGVQEVLDDTTFDEAIKGMLMCNGVDGEAAAKIAQHQGFTALNSLMTKTFASPELEAEYERSLTDWDEDDDNDGDEDEGTTDTEPFDVKTALNVVGEIVADCLGEGAVARMRTYNLTLGELVGHPDAVQEMWDDIAEHLDVRADLPKGIENYKASQIAHWMFDNQAK